METVRKGLRSGDVERDSFGRLRCTDCESELRTEDPDDEFYTVRECRDCGAAWKELN